MSDGNYSILFLSQHNAARSIIAEAVVNRLGCGKFKAFSAATGTTGELDSTAIDVLSAADYPTQGLRSKHWTEVAHEDGPALDFVFVLSDPATEEVRQGLPVQPVTANWIYRNPSTVEDEGWERRRLFGQLLTGLERQLRIFMQLPPGVLDRISLQNR